MLSWIDNLPLRIKLTLTVMVVLAVTFLAVAAMVTMRSNNVLAQQSHEALTTQTASLARAVELPAAVRDQIELRRVMSRMTDVDPRVLFAAVFDLDGRLLSHTARDEDAFQRYRRDPLSSADVWVETHPIIVAPIAERLSGTLDSPSGNTPGQDDGGGVIGSMVVGMSTAPLHDIEATQQRFIVAVFVFALLACGLVIYVATRTWTNRLGVLVYAANGISRGELGQEIDDARRDDIGQLADAFNHMQRAVRDRDTELRQFNHNLQQEVEQRTRDLRAALVSAEAASRAKSEFLANMSHEIRTPMTAIVGYADLLTGNMVDESQARSALLTIRRNGDHLIRIINDILDISKIEAGRMDVECIACSIRQVVEEVASLMMVRARDKGVELQVEFANPIPHTVRSDPTRLRQILVNLVSNAIKFTERGSVRLEIRLAPEMRDGRVSLLFDVIDSGIGIEPEKLDGLFSAFTQADASMTRRFGGTGLGLAISHRLAQMLGGEIRVASTPDVGSRFTLEMDAGMRNDLELVDVEQLTIDMLHEAAFPATPQRTIAARVLLAEDGPDNQRLIQFILKHAGIDVDLVDNGQAAVDAATREHARGHPYDVILMDMQMPVMDGYQASTALRRAGYPGPIIALTAHAMAGDREKCLDAGCSDYATKPVDRLVLLQLIERYVQPSGQTTRDEPTIRSEYADDPEMRPLIDAFVTELESRLAAIRSAVEENDRESLILLSHQIKGAAGGYGYKSITDAARLLEERSRTVESLNAVCTQIDALAALHRQARAGLSPAATTCETPS